MYKHSQYFLTFFFFENTIYIKKKFCQFFCCENNKPIKIKFKRSQSVVFYLNFFFEKEIFESIYNNCSKLIIFNKNISN